MYQQHSRLPVWVGYYLAKPFYQNTIISIKTRKKGFTKKSNDIVTVL